MRRSYEMVLHRWLVPGLLILVVVGIVYFSSFGLTHFQDQAANSIKQYSTDLIELDLDETAFAERLEKCDIGELTEFLSKRPEKKSLDLAVNLDRLKKRLAAADHLIQLKPEAKSREIAVLAKLDVLMDWETLAQEHDFADPDRTARLASFAKSNLDADSEPVASGAQTAISVAAIAEFLDQSPGENRRLLADEALRQFQLAVDANENNDKTARVLFDWLEILRAKSGIKETAPFFAAYEAFDSSSSQKVRDLVAAARKQHARSDIQLVDLMDSNMVNRDAVVTQFMEQADSALDSTDAVEADVLFVLERAIDLLALAKFEEARKIRSKIAQMTFAQESNAFKERLSGFDQQIELFAGKFNISNFRSLDDQPVEFRRSEAKFRILFLVSPDRIQASIAELSAMLKSLGPAIAESRIELTVIFVGSALTASQKKDIRQFADKTASMLQAWVANNVSPGSLDFLTRGPNGQLPFTIVLDADDRVICLEPSLPMIEEMIFQ